MARIPLGQARGVDVVDGVVQSVGVAVPGLGFHGVDGGEASGVGGHPAGELGSVLAELRVVEGGLGVAFVAGEFVGGDAGVGRV